MQGFHPKKTAVLTREQQRKGETRTVSHVRPIAVYLHWPFCLSKCPYCDFNSHVRCHSIDETRFSRAFEQEIESMRRRTGARKISSIFIGGGTPSLMEPATVEKILKAVAGSWTLPENVEVTLEANPSSAEAERFKGYYAAGVNRLSLGVQALREDDLRFLGREHSVEEALQALQRAKNIFPRLSFDLIYARPNQSLHQWKAELEEACAYEPGHLSLYQLTIEEGTRFYTLHKGGKIALPASRQAAALYKITQNVTDRHGMPAYEVSNHAREGEESVHNLNYWRYGEYVGIGPGAHGRFLEAGHRVVTFAEKVPEKWLHLVETQGHGIVEQETLVPSQEGDEFLLMGLRLVEGIDPEEYAACSGRRLLRRQIVALQKQGLLDAISTKRVRASLEGLMVLDALVADLAFQASL